MERPTSRTTVARALAAIASLVVAAGLMTTVGISTAAAKTKHGPARQCTAVSDVLSDGPTLTADPVGYAEAQILPLQQLKLSDPALKKAVAHLAKAYKAYSGSNGAKTAVKVTADEARVNAICPNAAP